MIRKGIIRAALLAVIMAGSLLFISAQAGIDNLPDNESEIQTITATSEAVNDPPSASNVTISGQLRLGETLTGSYTYVDAEGDSEGTSTFQWYRSNNSTGTGREAIPGAEAITYTVTIADAGKYLSFEVTPKALSGSTDGAAVESARRLVNGFAGGSGTSSSPYQVSSALEFQYMTEMINSSNSFATKHYVLTNDIVLPAPAAGESNHTPIGNNWFDGSFDGQGHSISGVVMNRPSEFAQALFSSIGPDAVVKNLRVINAVIKGNADVGGICAYNYGTIDNCYFSGSVNTGSIAIDGFSGRIVGGISAQNTKSGTKQGVISNCVNAGTVTSSTSSAMAGGITSLNDGIILNCSNTGTVATVNSETGGIVGRNQGSVVNCYNTAAISGASSTGGIVGSSIGTVINSYNTGNISGGNNTGGIAGGNRGMVINAYNTGTVAVATYSGGIVGSNSGTVMNTYNIGNVNGTSYSGSIVGSNSGQVTNNYWLTSTNIRGVGYSYPEGTFSGAASFTSTAGTLAAASGHTIIEGKTTLIAALNAWTATENNKEGAPPYHYWKSAGSYPVFTPALSITVGSSVQNGSVSVNKTAAEGHTVTMAPVPAEGYRYIAGTIRATYNGSAECALTALGNGNYTFTMPDSSVTVTAEFEIIPATAPTITAQPADTTGYYGIGAPLSLSAQVSDGGTLSYQWYKGENASDVSPADEKKTVTGNPATLPSDLDVGVHYFFCVVTNTLNNGETASTVSNTVALTVHKGTPELGTVSAGSIYVGEELSLSTLSGTNTTISGTLSWEANEGFDSSIDGIYTVYYSFAPTGEDASRYNPLTGQSVSVTVSKRTILSVSAQTAVDDKDFGTAPEGLALPASVSVTAQGTLGSVDRTLPVIWSGYNPDTLEPQTLTGTLDLSGSPDLINTDGLTASLSVTLQPLPAKALSDVTAKIKVGSTDASAILKALVIEQFDESIDTITTDALAWGALPASYDTATDAQRTVTVVICSKYGYTPQTQEVNIRYDIVNPSALSCTTETIPALDATDSRNFDMAALLNYVNMYRALTATWDDDAVGTTTAADNAPAYTALPTAYVQTGTTYEFSQEYLGHTLTQSVTVNEVRHEPPELLVNYILETINTTGEMAYQIGEGPWTPCTNDMSILAFLGNTVSFKTVSSGYKVDSLSTEVTFPAREAHPQNLRAVINDGDTEITVSGLSVGTLYEYSLDGASYSALSADGKIAVPDYLAQIYVRKSAITAVSVCSEAAAVDVNYTMTFISSGGSAVSPAYAVSGVTVAEPASPTRAGYYLDGWFSEPDGKGNKITFPYTMTGNITVYANWNVSVDTPPSNALIVNGTSGSSSTEIIDGQTVTTIQVDDTRVNAFLENSGENPTVTLSGGSGSDAVVGELSGQTVKNMESKEATLEIKTETATYTLPAALINIDAVSAQLGEQVELKDVKISVKIAEPPAETVKIIEDAAKKGSYQLVVKPVTFEITCTSGEQTISVTSFSGYVERTVAIPDGVDPDKITTGVVLNDDDTFRHVPTQIVMINGKYYAKICSLTNSTYSVIYSPVTFADISNHWAKDAVNDMGSRMVITGIGQGIFEPGRSITRAEFAAIIVRALGLPQGVGESGFSDVSGSDWFCGYVSTATAYGLITGYDSTSFRPNETITREQAMTIMERAMKKTGLSVTLNDSEISSLLAAYTDGNTVSGYARASVAACLKTGLINGSSATTLSPKGYVTRAEAAVMVQRLLQKSGLI